MTCAVLAFHGADIEDELRIAYYLLTICTGCSAACIFSECYVVRLDVLTIQMFVFNYYEVY